MKTIVFSDTHFGDFDEKRFFLLKKLILQADKIIINGDFWEKDKISFDQFCENWKDLFNVLKSKQTIYIFGNHDPKHLVNEKANLFSDIQAWNYRFFQDGVEYYLEHGHDDEKLKQLKYKLWYGVPKKLRIFLKQNLSKILIKLKLKTPKFDNQKYFEAKKIQETENKKSWFIFSDIHRPFVDRENKIANTGFIDNGFFSYILIDGKNLELVEGKY